MANGLEMDRTERKQNGNGRVEHTGQYCGPQAGPAKADEPSALDTSSQNCEVLTSPPIIPISMSSFIKPLSYFPNGPKLSD